MFEIFTSILLGIIQGLGEFLPISSSVGEFKRFARIGF